MCAESFAFAEFLRDTSSKKVYDDSHASSCVGTLRTDGYEGYCYAGEIALRNGRNSTKEGA